MSRTGWDARAGTGHLGRCQAPNEGELRPAPVAGWLLAPVRRALLQEGAQPLLPFGARAVGGDSLRRLLRGERRASELLCRARRLRPVREQLRDDAGDARVEILG